MPTVRGVPLKRQAFEGDGWKGAATDAKQMRLTPVTGLAVVHDTLRESRKRCVSPYPEGVYPRKTQYPDLAVPYNRDYCSLDLNWQYLI